MLPESRILRNKFHNDSVVKLIMEQPSLDDPTAVIDQAVKQQYANMGDEYGIKGLTGNVPRFIPKEIKSWYEKKYKRKFPPGMTTYASWPEYVADVLYQSKGTIDTSIHTFFRNFKCHKCYIMTPLLQFNSKIYVV